MRKRYSFKSISSLSIIFCIVFILTMAGCLSEKDTSKSKSSKKTGSLIVRANWEINRSENHDGQLDCDSTHIKNIEIKVYDSAKKLVTSDVFKCSDHKGTVSKVPEGKFHVVLIAKSSDNRILYIGEDGDVLINAGESNQADINASYFVPKGVFPPDRSNLTTPELTWEKVASAHRYVLKISTSSKMDLIAPILINGDITTFSPENLKEDTTYYWQIASMDQYGNTSQGTKIRTFSKTGTPQLSAPSDNSELLSCRSHLTWHPMNHTDDYEVLVSLDSSMSNATPYDVLGQNYLDVTNLENSIKYYWQVFAKDSNGDSANGSQVRSFKIENTAVLSSIKPGTGASNPRNFYEVGNIVFFGGRDKKHGMELWATNGKKTDAYLVKDINFGPNSSFPNHFIELNGSLLFSAYNQVGDLELWSSDGTFSGTNMVKDINAKGSSQPWYLTKMRDPSSGNEVIYFRADTKIYGRELWKSDGTKKGTVMVADLNPKAESSDPKYLTVVNQTLFFSATDGKNGAELYKLDAGGISIVDDIYKGSKGSEPIKLTALNETLYFSAKTKLEGFELWKLDTMGSNGMIPELVKDIYPGSKHSYIDHLTPVFDILYFQAKDGTHGEELWRSDGTNSGTYMIEDIHKGKEDSAPFQILGYKGRVYFVATDEVLGRELRYYNPKTETVLPLKDIRRGMSSSFPAGISIMNDKLYFEADDGHNGRELWVSDGTTKGTQLFKDIWEGPESGYAVFSKSIENENRLLFGADDGSHGYELWFSDGTQKNTKMIKDLNRSDKFVSQRKTINLNGTVLFTALEEKTGRELWRSDGTKDGTYMLKDIHPKGSSNPKDFVIFNNMAYFFASNGDNVGLWRTDGTKSGTVVVSTFISKDYIWPEELIISGGKLFFSGPYGNSERELYMSSGEVGRANLIDISPDNQSSDPHALLGVNGSVYFSAREKSSGFELWKSDGTEGGTFLVKDINPGKKESNPSFLTKLDSYNFYFFADDGTSMGLWKTDSRNDKTQLIKRLTKCKDLMSVRGKLYFSCRENGKDTLWISDGTKTGTRQIYTFLKEESQSFEKDTRFTMGNFTLGNGQTFFITRLENMSTPKMSREQRCDLWVIDDKLNKAKGLKKSVDLFGSIIYERLIFKDNRLIFPAFDPETGYELWETNGTQTNLLLDLNKNGDSFPQYLLNWNDTIIFSAYTEDVGFQLRTFCP